MFVWAKIPEPWGSQMGSMDFALKLLEEAALVVTLWRGREKLHYLNPVPIHEIAERWIGKFERGRLRALAELKKRLEGETDG